MRAFRDIDLAGRQAGARDDVDALPRAGRLRDAPCPFVTGQFVTDAGSGRRTGEVSG